ncbi:hypothetical protein J3R82DRAFT_6385 [Butyriboletus roseoflavus]|nr:hypothetical protein J3R82DRAFT_6385 [Butyriboletus roseoflavus]
MSEPQHYKSSTHNTFAFLLNQALTQDERNTMAKMVVVVERDDTGRVFNIPVGPWATHHTSPNAAPKTLHSASSSPRNVHNTYKGLGSLCHVLSDLFLPAGYPVSVSPAFCNSLSGLLASRGALEGTSSFHHYLRWRYSLARAQGVGVGDASASATNALLLTVLKDAISRFTSKASLAEIFHAQTRGKLKSLVSHSCGVLFRNIALPRD